MPRSPRRRIRFASVASRIEDLSKPGWADASPQGLASATDARTTRFCRTQPPVFVKRLRRYQVQVRRSFSEGGSVVRLRAVVRSRQGRPANTLHADAAASTASHPASVTTRDPPLVRDETAELIGLIWGDREGNCFCARDWTGQIRLIWLGKLVSASNGQVLARCGHGDHLHCHRHFQQEAVLSAHIWFGRVMESRIRKVGMRACTHKSNSAPHRHTMSALLSVADIAEPAQQPAQEPVKSRSSRARIRYVRTGRRQ